MPTLKPRVQVTLEPHTHEVIERLAVLQGRTRGFVIAELLDSVAPVLARTVALLEAAAEAPEQVKQGLRSVAGDLHRDLVELSGEASAQLDFALDQMGATVSDPHVVTRGSGMGVKPPHTKPKKPRKPSKPGGSLNG